MTVILETDLSTSRLSFIGKEMLPLPTNSGEVLSAFSTTHQARAVLWANCLQCQRLLRNTTVPSGCSLATVLLQSLPRATGWPAGAL